VPYSLCSYYWAILSLDGAKPCYMQSEKVTKRKIDKLTPDCTLKFLFLIILFNTCPERVLSCFQADFSYAVSHAPESEWSIYSVNLYRYISSSLWYNDLVYLNEQKTNKPINKTKNKTYYNSS